MRTNVADLVPIFRSDLQAVVLYLLLGQGTSRSVADLTRLADAPQASVYREVKRLAGAGLLATERVGRTVLYSPDDSNPAVAPLRQLVLITMGPVELLRRVLRDIDGITAARIFGSWAARASGEPGNSPGDIDVLVIGSPDRSALYAAVGDIEPAIGRPINLTVVSRARWERSEDPLLREIRSRPMIDLDAA